MAGIADDDQVEQHGPVRTDQHRRNSVSDHRVGCAPVASVPIDTMILSGGGGQIIVSTRRPG